MSHTANKIAIVTGASGGIGGIVATRLARDGFDIVASYAGRSDAADTVISQVTQIGRRGLAVKADVGNADDVERLFEETIETFGHVDVVVNCAGIMTLGMIVDADIAAFDRVIATNLRGTFLVFAWAAKLLSEGGRIIAFSSSVLAKSFPTYGAYIASKAGVEGLVAVLANELRGRKITVNAVAPGPVGTELFLKGKSAEQIATLGKLAPLERLGTPDDIAKVVSFLVGPDGEWVNAQVLRANGGFA
jgi:3-oxoacyl-[acyl-carrier protein] reductase